MSEEPPFWRRKRLADMTAEEWESLCDGCGKCCLIKLQDPDTDVVVYTDVACRLLNCDSCRCTDYPNRKVEVPDCVVLSPKLVDELSWMPSTCAYRLLKEGKELYWWHPLVSGDANTVHEAGISVRGRVIGEPLVEDAELPEHVVDWPS